MAETPTTCMAQARRMRKTFRSIGWNGDQSPGRISLTGRNSCFGRQSSEPIITCTSEPLIVQPKINDSAASSNANLRNGSLNSMEGSHNADVFHNLPSYADIMSTKYGRSMFLEHLSKMYASENMCFYEAVLALNEDADDLAVDEFHERASAIYNDFISEFADQEININSEMRTDILNELARDDREAIDRRLFASAHRFVYKLMEKAAWLKFSKTPEYQQLCQHGLRNGKS